MEAPSAFGTMARKSVVEEWRKESEGVIFSASAVVDEENQKETYISERI